jgi:hypothetical protein
MGQKLEEAGYPDMSSAVRPMALSPDERFLYFHVSFFHGFVEYDLETDRVLRLASLPMSDEAARTPREEYLNADEREVARIPVGDHPQRMRMGKVRTGLFGKRTR